MWLSKANGSILYLRYGDIDTNNKRVFGFDLDWTIIRPKTGFVFPKSNDVDDWVFRFIKAPEKIREQYKNGYRIIIHTNQKNLKHPDIWKQKITNILDIIRIPCEVYVALMDDYYRKPRTGIWDKFIKCDVTKSCYCGDNQMMKHNYSIYDNNIISGTFLDDGIVTDLKLALNVGIKYIHCDTFFKNKQFDQNAFTNYFNFNIVHTIPKSIIETVLNININETNMIICVGYPGCGKSYFVKNHLNPSGIVRINQDELKTKIKCKRLAISQLELGNSIVIDNTNLDRKTRQEWCIIGRKYKTIITILYFDTPIGICRHNNIYRHITSGRDIIPNRVYNIMRSRLECPKLTEDIDKLITIPHYIYKPNLVYKKYMF